jgi:methionine-rich copper-binding protein CopC
VRTLVGAVLLALAASAVTAAPAAAHDELVSSSPADQSRIARTPAEIVLTFDEPAIAMGTRLVVTGPGGEVQQGAPRLVDRTVTQSLAPGAPAGAYTVDWRVTSADGHPVSGVLRFSAAAAGVDQPGPPVQPTSPPARTGPNGAWLWLIVGLGVVSTAAVAVRARRRRDARRQPVDRPTARPPAKENS